MINVKTDTTLTLGEILGNPISHSEALQLVKSSPESYAKFMEFEPEHQVQVLEFIQGMRGLPILYDSFFKAILDPFSTPERLQSFLSCLLNQNVTIIDVLTRDGTQLVEAGSLVIMDILVQIEDGSYVNVEMQKHGYAFAGERSSCYMSDLVMRQYNRIKSKKSKDFSYKDMKPVYLIILMEQSTENLKKVFPHYIHRSQHSLDSGAELNLLTNYLYISLDTFRSVVQNEGIHTYLDAWLTFLSSDRPEDIIQLVEAYPEFKEYYHDIQMFRTNPEELMNMFSEALLKMDRNTVNYMIEEMKKDAEQKQEVIDQQAATIDAQASTIDELRARIAQLENK